MPLFPYLPNSGTNCATGSLRRIRPSSISFTTLVVVATTLVSEARSKIVSSVIASGDGRTARCPKARRYTIASPRPTTTTAPGNSWRAIPASTSGAIGAAPSSFTATTDDKGRFSMIGLRSGQWTFSAQSPGFGPETFRFNVQTIGAPNPPLTFTLKKGGAPAPTGALGGIAAKDLQAELAAADQAYNLKQWDEAVTKYQAILAKAPAITAISLQIASVYRAKADE